MKLFIKFIILVLLGFETGGLSGQGSLNLLDPGKMWSSVIWSSQGGTYYVSYYNRFSGDTIIEGVNYIKVLQAEDEAHSDWYLHGFIREDAEEKIYGRNLSGDEGLIYYFGLTEGDSISISNPFELSNLTAYVTQVDTILIQPGGSERKRIGLIVEGTPEYPEYWIEGVGSDAGVLWSGLHALPITGHYHDILCHWENEDLVYKTSLFSQCYISTLSAEPIENREDLSVYPLPLTTQSVIEVNGHPGIIYSLEIWNCFGQRIRTRPVAGIEKVILSREELKPGIYLIVLRNEQGPVSCIRFSVL